MFSLFFKVVTIIIVIYCIFVLTNTREIRSVYDQIKVKQNIFLKNKNINNDNVRLYFYNSYGDHLIGEDTKIKRIIDDPEKKLRKTLVEFFKGPKSSDLYGFKTDSSVIRNIFIDKNICYIDLSRNILVEFNQGIKAEDMFLKSIIKICSDTVNVDYVKFLINGDNSNKFKHLSINKKFSLNQKGIL